MRVIGYCIKCRKIKQVKVQPQDLSFATRGGVVSGVCATCEEGK